MNRVTRMLVKLIRVLRMCGLRLKTLGRAQFGAHAVVGPNTRIARGASVRAGNRVNIGANFACEVHLRLGDDIMVSSNVSFVGNDHQFDDPAETIQSQGSNPTSSVCVEGDNLIGFGTLVVGNVTIGHGAIVGAGSLVTRDLPGDTICVGRPAVPVRHRYRKASEE